MYLFAHEVAACIGENRFESVEDAILVKWELISYYSLYRARVRNGIIKIDNTKYLKEKEQIIYGIAKIGWESEKELDKKINEVVKKELDKKINEVVKKEEVKIEVKETIHREVKRAVYKESGKIEESKIIEKYVNDTKIPVRQRNNIFYEKQIEGTDIKFGGRLDGINGDDEIIEVKNRMNRLFKEVPYYELIQLHIYMYILDKSSCIHIENFKGQSFETKVLFDEKMMKNIIQRVKVFCSNLQELMKDNKKQDDFLTRDDFLDSDEE